MHVGTFLHKTLAKSLPSIHKKRLNILSAAVFSLINNGRLTLTALGQNLCGTAKVKNKIKAIDRLLGNKHLFNDKFVIYQQLAKKLLQNTTKVSVILDYSGCCSKDYWVLRASLVGEGRSITLYQEVCPAKKYDNAKIKKSFLKKLKLIIPEGIQVILITDAGFRTTWFKLIKEFGWEFVGRARGKVKIQSCSGTGWQEIKNLFKLASNTPKFLGEFLMSKSHQFSVYLYLYKTKLSGRKVIRKKGRHLYPDKQEKYSRSNREPWLLVSSLAISAKKIVRLYKKRMQIEQNFRDDKNERWGFGWRYGNTKNEKRFSILLLIAYIAALALWLIGRASENKNLHHAFKANTAKKRTLSYLTLAKQVLKHAINKINSKDIFNAMRDIVRLQEAY